MKEEKPGNSPLVSALSSNATTQAARGEYIERSGMLQVERTRPLEESNKQGKW
jgi:hypothetical protein